MGPESRWSAWSARLAAAWACGARARNAKREFAAGRSPLQVLGPQSQACFLPPMYWAPPSRHPVLGGPCTAGWLPRSHPVSQALGAAGCLPRLAPCPRVQRPPSETGCSFPPDLISIKNICSASDPLNKMETQVTDWEQIFAKHVSHNGLYPKYKNNSLRTLLAQSSRPTRETLGVLPRAWCNRCPLHGTC